MALVLVLMVFPRVALALLYFSANVVQRAYDGLLAPLFGFAFCPATTIAYAWIVNTRHPLSGSFLAALVIAVLIDAAAWSEATRPKAKPRGMAIKPEIPAD